MGLFIGIIRDRGSVYLLGDSGSLIFFAFFLGLLCARRLC